MENIKQKVCFAINVYKSSEDVGTVTLTQRRFNENEGTDLIVIEKQSIPELIRILKKYENK